MKRYLSILALLSSFFCGNVFGQSCPTAPAMGFNVFLEHGATLTGTKTEGAVAVGGDLTVGGNYNVSTTNVG